MITQTRGNFQIKILMRNEMKNGNKHKIIYNCLSQHLFYEFSND